MGVSGISSQSTTPSYPPALSPSASGVYGVNGFQRTHQYLDTSGAMMDPGPIPAPHELASPFLPQGIPTFFQPSAGTLGGVPTWLSPANLSLDRLNAQKHKEQGSFYQDNQRYEFAVSEYLMAIAADPSYADAYYNLGKTYVDMGQDQRAAEAFRRLLIINPQDHESRTQLAEALTRNGNWDGAIAEYDTILAASPNFDPAKRKRAWLRFQQDFKADPTAAQIHFTETSQKNLKEAKAWIYQYYKNLNYDHGLDTLTSVSFQFAKTQTVNRTSNLAEYDDAPDGRGIIRLMPELAFAHPRVIAAYLAHELVHAADDDAISSIIEEQDGYEALAQFWKIHKGELIEPNLDLALDLLNQSPGQLRNKVRHLYQKRDPLLPEKSPGHGLPLHLPNHDAHTLSQEERSQAVLANRIKNLLPTEPLLPGVSPESYPGYGSRLNQWG